MKIRWMSIALCAALAGASLASCSSSSSSSAGGSPASKLTGTPVVVGNIGPYSGAQASSEAGAELVLKAWAQSVNDNGGINGHPLKLIVKDLGNNAAGGLAAAKELVEQDHAVAIVGEQDGGDTTWAKYIEGTGVPVIGGLSIDIPFATNADFYPAGSNVFALIYGELLQAKQAGGKFGLLYCAESPQCASGGPLYASIAQQLGVTIPVDVKVAANAPTYTAVCQQLKDAGVQSYQVASGSAVVMRIAAACAQAGVTAKSLAFDGSATGAWTTQPALDGAEITEADAPFVSTVGAGPKAYQTLLAKYLPKLGTANGPNAEYSFVAGRLFEAAASAAGGTVTSQSLVTALDAMKGETLGGLAPPLTFTKGKPTAVNCYFTMGFANSAFTAPVGNTTTCAPAPIVKALSAVAGAA